MKNKISTLIIIIFLMSGVCYAQENLSDKNYYIQKAGINLRNAGECMVSGFIIGAIAPFAITSKDVVNYTTVIGSNPTQYVSVTTKEYNYTSAYICAGAAGALELIAIVYIISAGNNLKQAANAPDKKISYRLSPVGGSICFRF